MRGSELQRRRASEASTVHGMYKTRQYAIWNTMVERCRNPRVESYCYYGGRGIRVAPEWRGRGGFARFWAYAGPTYQAGLSLDRIDPNGHYEPGNIRWIPLKDQAVTRRRTKWIDTPKGRMCVAHAAKTFDIPRTTLRRHLAAGLGLERLVLA
jgi:helix-turn-helix, Psq domain